MHTIGADPELFLRDPNTGGVVPVVGLIGGTKDEPRPLPDLPDGFAVQEDNVMLEFNIPPADNPYDFDEYIGRALEAAINLVRTRQPDIEVDFAPYRAFTPEQLDTPQAAQFGCAQDFDAYTGGTPHAAPKPDSLLRENGTAWRFAGGHVHIGGYDSTVPEHVVAQFCDVFLGLPSVALDKQGPRRTLYGSAGRFRNTQYGIEYRTLSNFWVFDSGLRQEIGQRALSVAALASDEEKAHALFLEVPWHDVAGAINNEDENLAADLIAYVRNDLQMEV